MEAIEKPLPVIDDDNRKFYEFAHQHELRMQQCTDCDHIRFPPGIVCPRCHSMQAEWTKLSGKGKVYSYTVYHIAFHPAFQKELPYTVAIIQLEEGPRLESNITGCKTDEIKIDMAVKVYFEDVNADLSLPKFKPVG
jgi:uncharacterized protein